MKHIPVIIIEGSYKSNFRHYGQMEKQRWEESEKRREEKKKEDQRRERIRRQKMQVREKVGKSRNTVFFE
jgi:ribosomal protein L9